MGDFTKGCRSCLSGLKSFVKAIAHGKARKISLLFIILSFLGYIIFVAGFGVQVGRVDLSSQAARALFLPYWGVVVFGPITFVLALVHMAVSDRFRRVGHLIETITTFSYFAYTITIASPFVVSALFIFGASSFGDFDRFVSDIFPLPSIQEILNLDSAFLDVITGLVGTFYNLLQEGAESIVDLVLSIPSGEEFDAAVRSQFSGCCISLFFMACSIALWPFYSSKQDRISDRDLSKN